MAGSAGGRTAGGFKLIVMAGVLRLLRTFLIGIAWFFAWLVAFGLVVWAAGALYYDFPAARSIVSFAFLLAMLAALILVRGKLFKWLALFGGVVVVLAWWLTQKPRSDRHWQSDVEQTAWAEITGDEVKLHNVRNCEYRSETDYTPRWETRTLRLSQLKAVDLAITYWGSPYMAHPIASFEFTDDSPPVCFSIETRKEVGENYSAIGGFYRQYELICIVSDERDVVRLRTNYRKGEDVYLFRTTMPPDKVRERFLEYVATVNELHGRPRWYNAATTNCTTSIRTQHAAQERAPWDWRMLVNGKGDELLFERRAIVTGGLPFADLKRQAHINPAAQSADSAPDFSKRIRAGRAGFEPVRHSSLDGY